MGEEEKLADADRQDGLGAADTSTRPSQRAAKSRLIRRIDINLITGRRATDRYKYIHDAVSSVPVHAVSRSPVSRRLRGFGRVRVLHRFPGQCLNNVFFPIFMCSLNISGLR